MQATKILRSRNIPPDTPALFVSAQEAIHYRTLFDLV
jgi:hypothetical protein